MENIKYIMRNYIHFMYTHRQFSRLSNVIKDHLRDEYDFIGIPGGILFYDPNFIY